MGDKNVSLPVVALFLVGAVAGLTPLLRVPLEDGAPGRLRPDRLGISRGGDLDFLRGSDDPCAPRTLYAVRLEVSDCITASAMMYESANSGPSVESSRAIGPSSGPDTKVGAAKASSPVGEPPPKRAVRPLSEDGLISTPRRSHGRAYGW